MLWKTLVAAVLCVLSTPAFADQKGDALVANWIARIPDLLPITAETTTTYKLGKWIAIYKNKVTLASNYSSSGGSPYQFDDEYPMGLFNHPLGDNFDPLPYNGAADRLGIVLNGNGSNTKYLGKETVDGTTYDVVEVRENLVPHIHPVSPMLAFLRRKEDNRVAVNWYFDSEGVVRRMKVSAEVQVPDPYVSFRSAFSAPAIKVPDAPAKTPVTLPAAQSYKTETFTATMVVDSMRKTRKPLVRAGLSDPLYTVPESSRSACVFSPDGKLLAVWGQDKLQIIQTSTGLPKYRLDNFKGMARLDFSLDGKAFAFADADGVKVLRTEDGTLIRTIATSQKYLTSIRLSSDGKRIALAAGRPDIEIWSVETGLLQRTLQDNSSAFEAMFVADGKRLVTVGYNSDILIWDTDTWKINARLPNRMFPRQPLALSRDGKYIAAVNADNVVLLWDGSSNTPARKLKGAAGSIRCLTFSNDGKSLYAGDRDELSDLPTGTPGYTCWDIETGAVTADRSPWQLKTMSGLEYGVISPDGRFAAFPGSPAASGSVAVFALQPAK